MIRYEEIDAVTARKTALENYDQAVKTVKENIMSFILIAVEKGLLETTYVIPKEECIANAIVNWLIELGYTVKHDTRGCWNIKW